MPMGYTQLNEAALAKAKGDAEETARLEWERRGSNRCSTCKAPVVFAKHFESEKFMIFDALPDWDKGAWTLTNVNNLAESLVATFVVEPEREPRDKGVPMFTDHHATCRYVDEHRAT